MRFHLSFEGCDFLLEFCKCGSLMTDGQCSNKNCPHKVTVKSDSAIKKRVPGKKSTEPKSPKTRRASKVITYNLYDIKEEEQ